MRALIFFILAFAPAAHADELTLETALREAQGQSPELKRLQAHGEAVSWRRLSAISAYIPHLSLDGTHIFSTKYERLNVLFGGQAVEFPSAIPQDAINLTASWTVFDGLGSWHAFRAAKLELEAAEHELGYAAFRLNREVTLRFNQALAAAALEAVAAENIRSLEDHLALARATERSGMGTHFNVLRVEAQLEEAQAEKSLAADNLAIARIALSRALGRDTDDTRPIRGELPAPTADRAISTLSMQTAGREDIQAERAREAALDAQSSAAAGFWFPKVSLFAREQFYKYGDFDPAILPNASLQNAYAVGVNLRWDLFDGGASYANRQAAAAKAREAAERTHEVLENVPVDFETSKRRYLYNSALYRARLRTIEKSKESVRLAKLGLRAGTNTNTEVLDAELDLFRARAGLVRAQADAAEALVKLELASGKDLRKP